MSAEIAANIPIEETYQTPPTIVFDYDTLVEEGDEVERETVLSPVGEMRVVQKRKRSHFYLNPYVNEPSKIGRWRKGKPMYHALGWLDEAKYTALSKWLKDKDGVSTIKGRDNNFDEVVLHRSIAERWVAHERSNLFNSTIAC